MRRRSSPQEWGSHRGLVVDFSGTRRVGRIVGAAAIARDISERKRLEQEQARATGLLERFIDYTAHDFKTPCRTSDERTGGLAIIADGQDHASGSAAGIVANSVWMNKRTGP